MTNTRFSDLDRIDVPVDYPPAPDGQVLYVVGDIHGRRDLLQKVHELIDRDKERTRIGDVFHAPGPSSPQLHLVKSDQPGAPDRQAVQAIPSSPNEAGGSISVIGPELTVRGRIVAKGDVQIDGRICGDIYASRVVVGQGARIEGAVVAGDVTIGGSVQGTVRGNNLTIGKGASVKADLLHRSLVVEEGCHFEGRSRQSDDPLSDRHAISVENSAPPQTLEIYLGDYIDRGDDSRGVVDLLIQRAQQTETVFLRGNHEQFLLDFVVGSLDLADWRQVGSLSTLRSYGVQATQFGIGSPQSTVRSDLQRALAAQHLGFYNNTLLYFVAGRYAFAHAGVRPGIALERQVPEDLMTIRRQFLDYEGEFEHVVVHGHTPVRAPEFRHNRINLDTAAYSSGRLTCLRIGPDGPRILEA